jgi:ADP-heptose:LPS heptosyltransferase
VERILALKETCRRHAVSTYHVLVDAVSSFFCGQPPDLAWLQESANTALNFHPVIACKRWPYFPQLAEAFADVVIVGTADDLRRNDGAPFQFPLHARLFVDKLTLRETAELLATAGAVVGNDSGLSHMAAAVGTPTVMLFGPTPHLSLGHFPPNVHVLRAGLEYEPCWFGARFRACAAQIHCLRWLTVETVEEALRRLLGVTDR